MRQGPMGERDTWKYSERWTDRLQATGYCSLAYMAQPPLATLRQFDNIMQGTCRHVQQVAGGTSPCAAECRGHVAMCWRCGAAAHGLLRPPPRSRLVSAAARQPAVAPQWVPRRHGANTCPAVATRYWHERKLVTWFFQHISTYRKILWKSAHKVLKHFVPVINWTDE